MRAGRIPRLIDDLASDDAARTRKAGDALVEAGPEAVEALLAALRAGPASVRKPAAFLLGRFAPEIRIESALVKALKDPEPKVRKNAAIALGRGGGASAAPALAGALTRETVAWVRPSLILALGAIAGGSAAAILADVEAQSPQEAEALRKARERVAPEAARAAWRANAIATMPVAATVPVGLEDVSRDEARAAGLDASVSGPGLLRFDDPHPSSILRLRTIYFPRLLAGTGPTVAAALAGSAIGSWREFIDTGGGPLRYRVVIEGTRQRKDAVRAIVAEVRRAVEPLGLQDSPSQYAVQLAIAITPAATQAWLVPAFQGDTRFAYRRRDVGAAINPSIAAALARLVRVRDGGVVIDATCGSGTMLVERGLLDPSVRLHGVDISPTAIAASGENAAAAGLADRCTFVRGDAADPRVWLACDEAIMNLPFGIRTRTQDRNLGALYAGVVANLARRLRPDGRAVLYTANVSLMRAALAPAAGPLAIVDERQIEAGGLRVNAWVLANRRGGGGQRVA